MNLRLAQFLIASLLASDGLASLGWAGVDIPPECRKPGVTVLPVRSRLEPIPKYREQKDDVYLFPDEPRYQELITKKIATPLDIRLEIRDEKGRPYSIEEAH